MLIDMHAHSAGISICCKASPLDVITAAKEQGIDGVILTNHYTDSYRKNETVEEFARRFVDEYEYTRALGAEHGVRVFFGIEVTMALHDNVHMLVYGVDTDFVLKHPRMDGYTQEALYRAAHESGGVLVQAHPIRKGRNVLLDLAYLDGVEVNSHPKYDSTHYEELSALAIEHGKLLTSGGDYHKDTHRVRCGVFFPDTVESTADCIAYLQHAAEVRICHQQPSERESRVELLKRLTDKRQ